MMFVGRVLAMTCVAATLAATITPAQGQDSSSPSGPILYRKHLMAEELIAEQGAGYLPMQRARFEAAIQQRSQVPPVAAAPRIVEATYRARLTSEDVFLGTAECKVAYSGEQPVAVALSPCGLAVGQLRWSGESNDEDINASAGVSPTGEFRAIIDGSGTLRFPWALRGSRIGHGAIEFPLRLPICAVNHLLLELPTQLVPRAAGAIIQLASNEPAIAGHRLWSVDAASNPVFILQLESLARTPEVAKPIFVRESLTYRLTTAGLELVASYHLDVTAEPIRELLFEIPTSVQVASVTIADKPALVESLCSLTDVCVYRVSFPEPQRGTDLELVMILVSPILSGQNWELPTIQLWDTHWQSGSATIETVEPLNIMSVENTGSIARKVEPLPLPDRGELRQFQCYSPDRYWTVWLAENVQDFMADVGLTLRFAESVITGQLIADVQAIRGNTFQLRALVEPGWIVDTVQTEPAESFEVFHATKAGQQSFDVKLKQALNPDRKIRLIIRGHRRNPVASRAANLAGMKFVRLEGVRTGSSIVALGVESPLHLSLTGNQETLQVERPDLTAAEASRLNDSPESVIFRDEAALNTVAVTQSPEQPLYSAQVNIEARIDSQSLTQAYEFQITPASSRVARLRIRIANSGTAVPSWEFVDAGENSLAARQLDSPEVSTEYQEWELTFVRPVDTPFRLRATSKNKLGNEAFLGLASVPEATSQSGLVRIVCSDGSPLDIATKNAQTVATGRAVDLEIQSMRGTYRYAPSQDASIQVRRSSDRNSSPPAWIWFTHLSSRVSGAGEVRHEARMYLESEGLSSLSLNLPEAVRSWSVSVDGIHVDADSQETPGRLVIPLPRGHRFPTVSVTFVTLQPSFTFASWVNSIWPTTNLTCLQRRWDVWTPPHMQVAELADPGKTWDERLFGFQLVRRRQASFNPFSIDDWRSLSQLGRDFSDSTDDRFSQFNFASGPWSTFPGSVGTDEFDAGWVRSSRTLSGADPSRLLVYSRRALQASGWGVLCIVVGILCSWRLSRFRLASIMIITAAVVLLLPEDLLPLLRGTFYGAVMAFLFTWVPRRLPVPIRSSLGAPTSSYRGEPLPAGTAAFVGMTSLILCGYALAQPPMVQEKATPGRVVFPVLIPVDDEQNPAGEYVYVPKSLFDLLLRNTGDTDRSALGPLITAAHYEIELTAKEDDSQSAELRQLRATYELSDVPRNASLRLPFRRDRVRVSDVRIDNQPAQFQWNDDGQSLRVVGENADCRTMTVNLRPIAMDNSVQEIDIPIPPIPRSRLTVRSDTVADRVQIPSARGVVERELPNVVTADLGPVNALRMNWGSVATSATTALNGEVAELVWMHMQPNATIVRAQFHLVLREGNEAEFVEIEVDPRLRLLPGNDDLAVQEVQSEGSRALRCRLENPSAKETMVELAFALTGGIGNIRVPHLSAKVERHATKLLAVTVADGFESVMLPAQKAKPIPSADFIRAWGRDDDVPQVVVSLDDPSESWQVAVRPLLQQLNAEQQVEIVVGQSHASIAYESVVVVERGSLLQQRFRVPAGFEPREIIAIHDDLNRVLRWARVDARTLTVFFTSPLAGTFRVWLKGDVRLSRNGRVGIPVVAAERETGKVVPVNRVAVFYRNDVQVKLESSPGLVEDSQTSSAISNAGQGRQLVALVARGDATGEQLVQLNLSPNRPTLAGSLVTILENHNSRWWADISIYLQFRGGYVDDVRLRFPAELEFPIEVTPKTDLEVVLIPGESDRQLVARLPNDDRRTFALRMRCALKEQEDGEVRAPDIRLPDSNQLQRFVMLPKLLDRTPLAWDTSGLQAAELPPNHTIAEETHVAADVYQIVAPHMTAQLKSTEPIRGSPQVRLADYRVDWFDDYQCQGMAAFDVEPAGLSDITLDVPPGLQLVNVAVGTVPVSTGRVSEQRWRVPLGMTSLPQRIEVLFHGPFESLARASQSMVFRGPVILDLPCAETFWTVQGPARFGGGKPVLTHTRTGKVDLATRRLETARQLLQSAPAGIGREGPSHAEPWRANRQQWLKQLEADLFQAQSADDRVSDYALTAPRYDLARAWSLPSIHTGPIVYGALRGAAGRFEVQYAGSTWRTVGYRLTTVFILVGIAVLTHRGLKMEWARELLVRYPHFAVAVLGFGWWMWLTPSILGIAIMILATAISLRSPWKTRAA